MMSIEVFGIIISILVPLLLVVAPWMFMVHAKLAVLATVAKVVGRKIERVTKSFESHQDEHEKINDKIGDHETRLSVVEEKVS